MGVEDGEGCYLNETRPRTRLQYFFFFFETVCVKNKI